MKAPCLVAVVSTREGPSHLCAAEEGGVEGTSWREERLSVLRAGVQGSSGRVKGQVVRTGTQVSSGEAARPVDGMLKHLSCRISLLQTCN